MSSTLDEICKFYSGTGFPNKFQGKTNGKYPFIKVGDISRTVKKGNITLTKSQNYINNDVVNKINGKIVPKDTIIFAKIGEALKLNRRVITNKECLIDNNILGIKPKTNKIDLKYLFYFMNHLKLEKFSESTTVPSVRQTRLKSITINIPSIDEQLEIVNILENINKAILLKRKQLSKLDILIKARFVEMFGDPANPINIWDPEKLGKICILNPKKEKKLENDDLDVSFVPMSAVSENGAINTTKVKKYSEVKKGFTYFLENDVLFAKITPCMENGKGAVAIGLKNKKGFGSTEFHVLRPIKGKSNPYWLYTLTSFQSFRKLAELNMTGSAGQKRVPIKFLQNYKVVVPPISLQNEFANFVQQVDKSKVAVQKSLDETQKLYDSLMQEYFG